MHASAPDSQVTLYADFNNADYTGRLRLNLNGTRTDLKRLGMVLSEGLRVVLSDGELSTSGLVQFSHAESIWVAEVDWSQVHRSKT